MITTVTTGWMLLISIAGGEVIATHSYDTHEECISWAEAYDYVKKNDPDSVWAIQEQGFTVWRFDMLTFDCHEG